MFPLYPLCWVSIINGYWILSKVFFASIEVIIWLLFVNLLLWCITLIYLWLLSHSSISETSPTWLQYMILLMYYWIWFPSILLKLFCIWFSVIFAYNFLSFLLVVFFGFCMRVTNFHHTTQQWFLDRPVSSGPCIQHWVLAELNICCANVKSTWEKALWEEFKERSYNISHS